MKTNRESIKIAYQNIKKDIFKTTLEYSPELSKISGANVYLKFEHQQLTGSFKIRGVLNKVRSIAEGEFAKPFVTASTGNHAAAFCYASAKFGFKGVLYMPKSVNKTKIKAIEHYNVEKILYGNNSMEAEQEAYKHAQGVGGIFIHPYNDAKIIEGQGTIGVEIEEQLPTVDTVLTPIGGGGLASGLACYFDKSTQVELIGCQPENACEMYLSVKNNRIVEPSKLITIADAAAGGIDDNSITFDIIKNSISKFEIINDEDTKKAVAFIVKYHQTLIEPSSALPVAALLNSDKYKNKNVVLIITGKKINTELLTEILNNYANYY